MSTPTTFQVDLVGTLQHVVREHDRNRPRSLQETIGASEAGHPCARRLAHKIAGTAPVNRSDPWAAYVGTAVHAQLAEAFHAANENTGGLDDRYLIEHQVDIYPGITGTVDLYDTWSQTVIDHKILGDATLKKLRKDGPSQTYRMQVQLYALGLERQGHDVRQVAIAAWPRSGQLAGLHVWTAPNETWHLEPILERFDEVRRSLDMSIPPALMPATPDACVWCPYHSLSASRDLATTCDGEPTPISTTN